MTRFARAKGSKASNERRPEEASSWQDMRKQLEISQLQNQSATDKVSFEVKSSWKHKIANDSAHEENTNSVWTSFGDISDKKSAEKKKSKSKFIENSSVSNNIELIENKNKLKDTNTIKKKKQNKNQNPVEAVNLGNDIELPVKGNKISKVMKGRNNDKGVTTKKKTDKFCNKNSVKTNKNYNEKSGKISIKNKEIYNIGEENHNLINRNNNLPQSFKNSNSDNNPNNKTCRLNDNYSYKRRKPNPGNYTTYINGKSIDIVCYEGFFIKKEDAEHLRKLKKQFIKKGIPRNELQAIMKLERRKAEKSLAREKKKVCFQCRKSGHNLSECPELQSNSSSVSGVCFKCGSTEHTYFECKVSHGEDFRFAQCFICKEEGHIAKQCPDNPRGLYPRGGACRVCGDVTHMKKDCPDLKEKSEATAGITAEIFSGRDTDVLDEELHVKVKPIKKHPNKKIKYF